MDGVAVAKSTKGVPAFGGDGDFPAFGADGIVDHSVQSAVDGVQAGDAPFKILHQLAHTLEVSQSFLTGIEHKEDAGFGLEVQSDCHACHLHDSDGVGGVIADTRCVESAVFFVEGQRVGVGKDHIGVRKDGAQVAVSFFDTVREDDVERRVDVDTGGSQRFQILFAPFCPFFLMVGRSRNLCQLSDGLKVARAVFFQIAFNLLLHIFFDRHKNAS